MISPVFLSDLLRDYLRDAASITAGVPSNTALIKHSLSDIFVPQCPFLLVSAAKVGGDGRHPQSQLYGIQILLRAETAVRDNVGTPRATAEGWLEAIRERLVAAVTPEEGERPVPGSVLAAWIVANRTEQQRTGWRITRWRVESQEEVFQANSDDSTYMLSLAASMTVHLR